MLPVSIVVPIYSPAGQHVDHIMRLVASISQLQPPPSEVIFSMNHEFYEESRVREALEPIRVVVVVHSDKGAARNTNVGMMHATADFVKIMHQDDFFTTSNSLQVMHKSLITSGSSWGVAQYRHYRYLGNGKEEVHTPSVTRFLRYGINKIGAPSVVIHKRDIGMFFDDHLQYLFDCDWYSRVIKKFGNPCIIRNECIGIYLHDGQASNWAKELWFKEVCMIIFRDLVKTLRICLKVPRTYRRKFFLRDKGESDSR